MSEWGLVRVGLCPVGLCLSGVLSSGVMSVYHTTRNASLIVALNVVGTAYFDPRPAVVKFLEKTRRWGLQIWTSTGSMNSLGNSPAKRGSSSKIETTVKRTDLQVARDVFSNYCISL